MVAAWIVPFLAFMLAALFAARVWGQWSARRRPAQLAWALGLSAYALASLVEAYVATRPWTVDLYRVYFPLAAANVGLLGLGTVLLARRDAWAKAFAAFVALATLVAFWGPFLLPLSADQPVTAGGETRPLAEWGPELGVKPVPFPNPGRVAFLALSVLGGLALVGAAFLSAWQTRRAGVLLIALGALLPFLGGSLSSVAGVDARDVLQLVGIALMFAGFLKGQEDARRAARAAEAGA